MNPIAQGLPGHPGQPGRLFPRQPVQGVVASASRRALTRLSRSVLIGKGAGMTASPTSKEMPNNASAGQKICQLLTERV
jgi:hypothetical protein